MSTSISAVTTQYIAAYQEATTSTSCGLATTVLLLYDVLLTAGQEYRYIWRSRKTWVSRLLYVWNRYIFLLVLLLDFGTTSSISDISCTSLVWLTYVLQILNVIGPAMFTTLRIYALSKRNKILSGVALVLSMAPFVINASTAYLKFPINLSAPLNCTQTDTASMNLSTGLAIASRGSLILVDSLAVAVTWRQTRAAIQLRTGTLKGPSLEQVMLENGCIYFCTLVSLNIVDIALVILSIAIPPDQGSSYILWFIDPITSVLNSRFLLALHETNAQLEGAGDTSLSSLSLSIGSGDGPGPRAESPELPEFLGPIGGSLQSFPDEDLELLDFAPQSREEPIADPEAALGSGGGEEPA